MTDPDRQLATLPSPSGDAGAAADRRHIREQQLRYLYHNARTGLAVNVALGVLMCTVLWPRVEHAVLLGWSGAVLLLTFARVLQLRLFERLFVPGAEPGGWIGAFLVGSTLTGALWGMSVWILAPYPSLETPVFLAFALGGLTAGAAAVLGVVRSVYISYALVIMSPIIAWFFTRPDAVAVTMGAMLTLYLAAMLVTGTIYRRIVLDSIIVSQALARAKERAESASRAKTEFLSRMSHELRTPLNSILGFAQLLQIDPEAKLAPHAIEHVAMIRQGGEHLLTLINEVLDLARIEEGRLELQIVECDAHEIVAGALAVVAPLAVERGITLEPVAPTSLVLAADVKRLRQVLLNLLSNAIKYNRTEGRVRVELAALPEAGRISVSDDGPGIPCAALESIFEPFSRVTGDHGTTEGAGIGLTISRHLVESMGGRLEVESEPGHGATFHVTLPCARR